MTARFVLPFPSTPENAAKRQTAELLAQARVTNNHLRLALGVLCLSNLGSIVFAVKSAQAIRDFKPPVIRIDEHGRPATDRLSAGPYQPREAEVKYFLNQFVSGYYARIRSTLKESYTRSLYFLDPTMARGIVDADRKTKVLETFLAGQGEEIDVAVKNIVIEELRSSPYRASVDFEKVYYDGNHQETKRESYTANIVFTIKDHVPNNLVLVNPLGFTITYFREDQAFQ